jgi:hypothetical protein
MLYGINNDLPIKTGDSPSDLTSTWATMSRPTKRISHIETKAGFTFLSSKINGYGFGFESNNQILGRDIRI